MSAGQLGRSLNPCIAQREGAGQLVSLSSAVAAVILCSLLRLLVRLAIVDAMCYLQVLLL